MPGRGAPLPPASALREWWDIVQGWRANAFDEHECDRRLLESAERHGLTWDDVNRWWFESGVAGVNGGQAAARPDGPRAYPSAALPRDRDLVVSEASLASPGLRLSGALLSALLMVFTLVIGYLVWALIVWQDSTTPAKKLLGMKVVDSRTGQPLSYGGMVMRQVVWTLVLGVGSFFTAGVLGLVDDFFVFSRSRQRLLDRMASTLVVKTGRTNASR